MPAMVPNLEEASVPSDCGWDQGPLADLAKAGLDSAVCASVPSAGTAPTYSPTKMTLIESPCKTRARTFAKALVAAAPAGGQQPAADASPPRGSRAGRHLDAAAEGGVAENAQADNQIDAASRDSLTCQTEVSSLSAVPQTLATVQSAISPTRSQAGISELSIDEPDTAAPMDMAGDLTSSAAAAQLVDASLGTGMHGLPERQAAAAFIKELSSHSTLPLTAEVNVSIDAHAIGDALRPNGTAAASSVTGRALDAGGGNSRFSMSHASGGPLSALEAVESGSSSISMSCQMGPTASRASSDYAGTEYAATGPFVDSIVDGQVLGWMNATSTTYYQPE